MPGKFKTSQKVAIIKEDGTTVIEGAIVRSFNEETQEYYLTYRNEKQGIQVYFAAEDRLREYA
jgi:hypothetical protein